MVKVRIDEKVVDVELGTTVLEAAKRAGVEIPRLCVIPGLYEGSSCRLCLVKTPTGRILPSCNYRVYRDEEFLANTSDLWEIRRVNLELLLQFHRIECWLCERKGSCPLAELSMELFVDGLPVCSECPLPPSRCLLLKGEMCLGMIAQSGCGAECLASGGECWGCRGPITQEDVLERAFARYRELGFNVKEVLSKAEIYWNSAPGFEKVKEVAEKVIRCG
jgi:ferredoxin